MDGRGSRLESCTIPVAVLEEWYSIRSLYDLPVSKGHSVECRKDGYADYLQGKVWEGGIS